MTRIARTDRLGAAWSFAYDSRDNLIRTDDAEGRPASIVHARAPTELARFDYGFFADGLVRSIAEPGGARVFSYDATQQLTGGGMAATPESYDYDAEGNRTSSHLSASHLHDAANRLVRDESHCYDYDANGNLISKTELAAGACAGPVTAYSWDVRNRLVRIDFPDLTVAAYRYDALDRRIGKDAGGAVTLYVYDDDDILLEFDGANAVQARYGHGIEVDQPLVMERGGQSHFYHADHLGSIRLVTDGAGLAVNGYDYDAFGDFEPTTILGIVSPYAFTAREYDPESDLNYYRARYYDSSVGRFVGEDPIGFEGRDLNLYRYVYNAPMSFVDPRGTDAAQYKALIGLATGLAAGAAIVAIGQYNQDTGRIEIMLSEGGGPLARIGGWLSGIFQGIADALDPCKIEQQKLIRQKNALQREIDRITSGTSGTYEWTVLAANVLEFNFRVDVHNTECTFHPVTRLVFPA